ncbi:MAG TPA: TonB-dependent receptor [Planctomycetota bacterium]|nr:TonB-dependent receptor [Planctomycetota bacterium]
MQKLFLLIGTTLLFLSRALAAQQEPEKKPQKSDQDLSELSLEDLMKVEITSVSKSEHSLMETPAAVTVIRGDDIRRTGATTIAEALRLVPGISVARLSSNKWLVASRGFSDLFSTKLLVLIDGRSVYTPLFSGVLWPAQDVDLEDVDRIEVIRGPGATVWGANAVNGVINIITKKAKDTQGGRVTGGGGTQERAFGSARWGGMVGDDLAYRVYGKSFSRGPGKGGDDDWDGSQGGFRFDWTPRPSDSVTFQGDYYSVLADGTQTIFSATAPFSQITNQATQYSGGNLLLRWEHELAPDSKLRTQFYYDHTEYQQPVIQELRDTLDFDLQHQMKLFWGQQLTSGLGYRWGRSNTDNTPSATFNHPHRVSDIASGFIQDEIPLHETVKMTIGSKFEYNNYTGFEIEPGLRLSWRPAENHSVWFSAARAVRTPSQGEDDLSFAYTNLQPTAPPTLIRVSGSHAFESETMNALELGYRVQPHESVTLDIATFDNHYADLRTSEAGPPDLSLLPAAVVLPLTFGNKMHGHTWGVEVAAAWQAMEGVRFQGGYTLFRMNLELDPGSTDLGSNNAEKNDPRNQAFLRGVFDVVKDVQFDLIGRYVSRLQGRGVGSYTEMDARIGWKILPTLEAALVGQNLLQKEHFESSNSSFSDHASEVPRGVYASLTWKF